MVMLSLLIQGIFAEELITRHLPVLAGSQVVADGFVCVCVPVCVPVCARICVCVCVYIYIYTHTHTHTHTHIAGSQVVADGFVDKICLVPVKLQVSAVLIFTTLMVHNTPQVCVW